MMIKILAALFVFVSSGCLADWDYDQSIDKMTGKVTATASAASTNSLSLKFPYEGVNYAHLLVRQHPQHGLDVIFLVDRGQIMCRRSSDCSISVRFDDAPPVRFEAVGAADNSSTQIFLKNAKGFITKAKKAKNILVQVTMHTNGSPIVEFGFNDPLEWPKKK